MSLQVKRFYRNGKQDGPRDFWKGMSDPVEYLDMQVNEFCKNHKVVKVYHYPVTDKHNQYFVIIYEDETK